VSLGTEQVAPRRQSAPLTMSSQQLLPRPPQVPLGGEVARCAPQTSVH
jgi:hypothetical protein